MLAQSLLVSILLLTAGAIAQSTSESAAATNTRSSTDLSAGRLASPVGTMISIQVVRVGDRNGTGLKFYPEEVKAEPGSAVQFQFYPKNHTVTQSTFDKPCQPISNTMSNVTGINSGPMPPENGMMKVFTIMINDTKPLWMYCATADHCQKGMAMVINAPETGERTLAAYKALAARNSTSNSTNGTADPSSSRPGSASSTVPSVLGTTGLVAALIFVSVFFL